MYKILKEKPGEPSSNSELGWSDRIEKNWRNAFYGLSGVNKFFHY
jgi:hypothetical protein